MLKWKGKVGVGGVFAGGYGGEIGGERGCILLYFIVFVYESFKNKEK